LTTFHHHLPEMVTSGAFSFFLEYSVTTLLVHTVPHSTSHSFRPNANNQSIIAFKLCVHSSKIGGVENSEIYYLNGLLNVTGV
jgi:hypothetical protein